MLYQVVDWLAQDEERTGAAPFYAKWIPAEVYCGVGYSAGGWAIDWETLVEELPHELTELSRSILRTADAKTYPTLDDWLRADIRGELAYPGAASGLDRPGCTLRPETRRAISALASARQSLWPQLCADCGESFTPDRRRFGRCPDCRAKARKANGAKSSRNTASHTSKRNTSRGILTARRAAEHPLVAQARRAMEAEIAERLREAGIRTEDK
jgi:hypothetical protein